MKQEFNLSEKRETVTEFTEEGTIIKDYARYPEEDVKEFIRLLKEKFPINCIEHHKFHNELDKLAGEKLK